MIKYALRAAAIGTLILIVALAVHLQQSQAKYTIVLSGYNTPTATATGTPPGCMTIPGTGTQVGASCFAQTSCPAEDNFAHDPASFLSPTTTCTTNGTGDCSSAISMAMAAGVTQGGHGDVKFTTPGTYLVNLTSGGTYVNASGITPPAMAKFECTVPGVNIIQTLANPSDSGIVRLVNSNNTVCGCHFQGINTAPGQKQFVGSTQGAWVIYVSGGSNYTIEGNTIDDSGGDSAAGIADAAASNVTFQFNTCTAQPLYCWVFDQTSTGSIIQNNLATDSVIGAEWDGCNGSTLGTGVIIRNNEVISSIGGAGNGTSGYLEAEAYTTASTCNYSGLTMGPGNYCTGNATFPSRIHGGLGGSNSGTSNQSVITGNTLGPFCSCSNIGAGQSCP